MYTIADIDVFVMTHNRADFLKETLDCLLYQTARPDRITVFDNESTDDTESVVRRYESRGVRYVKTTGKDGNFLEMQKRAERPYVVHFHDDNLFHREYLEKVLKALNHVQNVAGVTCAYYYFDRSDDPNCQLLRRGRQLMNQFLIIDSAKEFCIHKSRAEARPQDLIVDNVSALIYKTEYFKRRVSMVREYGKADDTELFIRLLDYGKLVTVSDRLSEFIRQHAKRDVNTDSNSLSLQQAKNWVGLYLRQSAGVNDDNYWDDLLGMIYTQYPYMVKRAVFEELHTLDFLKVLRADNLIPSSGLKVYEEFISGRRTIVSCGIPIAVKDGYSQFNANESVAAEVRNAKSAAAIDLLRGHVRPLPVRVVRKIVKYIMPYAVVRIVQKIQDRVRFGKSA